MSLTTCNVICTINDDSGVPVVGAVITARLNRFEVYLGYVVPTLVQGVTDATGHVTLALWPNELGSTESMYVVKVLAPNGKSLTVNAVVPNVTSTQLHLIATLPAYTGKTDGELILTAAVEAGSLAVSKAAEAVVSATAASVSAAASQVSKLASDASATLASNKATVATTQATIATTQATQSAAANAVSNAAALASANTSTAQAVISTNQAVVATQQAVIATTQATNSATSAAGSLASSVVATTKASEASASAVEALGNADAIVLNVLTATQRAQQAASSVVAVADELDVMDIKISTANATMASSVQAASTSATNAANTAATMAATLASFRGVYLGAFASDAAAASFAVANSIVLLAGVMYENIAAFKFRIYNGTVWIDYDATAQASQSAAVLSATNAASSASTASTQAGIATTQATNAASSATAAASSLAAVAAVTTGNMSSQNANAVAITGGAISNTSITVKDNVFTLQDDVDPTKQAQFQLASIGTGITRTYTLPNNDTGLVGISSTQTFTAGNTFSANTNTFGSSTGTGTQGLGSGATTTGNTKTINVGTGGLSGSTTNITVGSANGSTTTMLGSTIIGGAAGNQSLQVNNVASAVNYWQASGAVTGGGLVFGAQGADTNIYVFYDTKGNEAHGFRTGGGQQVRISNTPSALNYLNLTGAGTGVAPSISAGGSDAIIPLNITSKSYGAVNINTGTGIVAKFIDRGTSTVDSPFIFRSGLAGVAPGALTLTVSPRIQTIDAAGIDFSTSAGVSGAPGGLIQVNISHTASAVNYLGLTGAATGAPPSISAAGSDANINLNLSPKGTGAVVANSSYGFSTNGGIGVGPAAHYIYQSATNTLQFKVGSSYMGFVDNSGSMGISSGNPLLYSGWGGVTFKIEGSVGANTANYLSVGNSLTGAAPTLSAQGSDSNIGLKLTPKGTGVVTVTSDAVINGMTVGLGGGSIAQNAAFGGVTLPFNTTGNFNVAVGYQSMFWNKIGSSNVGLGFASLFLNTTDNQNLAMGVSALTVLTTNVATFGTITAGSGYTNGTYTAVAMTPVSGATFVTYPTVTVVVSGGVVTSVTLVTAGQGASSQAATVLTVAAVLIGGTGSGFSIPVSSFASGGNNTAIGFQAGSALATGSNNTIIGSQASASTTTVNNEITLGNSSVTAFRVPGLSVTAAPSALTIGSQFAVTNTAFAINYAQVTGNAIGFGPIISAQGLDSNIALQLRSKGNFGVGFQSSVASNIADFVPTYEGYGVNFLRFTSAITTRAPSFSAQGSDTNISLAVQAKGTGAIDLAAGSSGVNISNGGTVTAITRTAPGGGYVSVPTAVISAPTTSGGIQATAEVALEPATFSIISGGTGYAVNDTIDVTGGTFYLQKTRLSVTSVSAGVITGVTIATYGRYTVLPTSPNSVTTITGTGSGASISITGSTFFSANITNAGSGYVEQPTVTFSGGGGGTGAAAYAIVGSGTTIKSLGSTLSFNTTGGTQFMVSDAAGTSTDYIYVSGSNFGRPAIGARTLGNPNASLMLFSTGTTGSIQFATNNSAQRQAQITHTDSAVNYAQITGGGTGNGPIISAQGSDLNIGLGILGKGIGGIAIGGTGGPYPSLLVSTPANTVNTFQIYGNSSGGGIALNALGLDSNISMGISTKGTGSISLYNGTGEIFRFGALGGADFTNYYNSTGQLNYTAAGGSTNINFAFASKGTGAYTFQTGGGRQAQISDTLSAVNYLNLSGGSTGNAPSISGSGSDVDVGLNFYMKGWNAIKFISTSGGQLFQIGQLTSVTANFFQALGNSTGNAPVFSAQGLDTNIGLVLTGKGTGVVALGGSTVANSGLQVSPTASAVNYIEVKGNISGQAVYLSAQGTDANIPLIIQSKGTQPFYFVGNNAIQFATLSTASAVNYAFARGGAVGSGANIGVTGSDTNIDLLLSSKGTGVVALGGSTAANSGFRVNPVASSVNYVQAQGGITGNPAIVSSQGTDSNVTLWLQAQGNARTFFVNGGAFQASINSNSAAVNYLLLAGGSTGNGAELSVAGSDANINLKLTPKGTGTVQFGTYTAGVLSPTGYITITDAAGTSRRLLVG